jgi:hypothetical protein
MEKAISIRRLSDLSDTAKDYDCIYFGVEFCQWLLCNLSDLMKVRDFCRSNDKKLVLVTPWVTDSGLDMVYDIISGYLKNEKDLEVVVNDFGMLKLISDEFNERVTITLGRLLSNQRRDPRTLTFKDIDCKELYEHYKHSTFDYPPLTDFLKKYNVERVEIDNLLQGVTVPSDIKGVSFSLYYPYNYVTVTRNCVFCYNDKPSASIGPGGTQSSTIGSSGTLAWKNKKGCMKNCIDTVLKLNCDEISETLYLKGTAMFIKNEEINLEDNKLINRLVYSSDIPV